MTSVSLPVKVDKVEHALKAFGGDLVLKRLISRRFILQLKPIECQQRYKFTFTTIGPSSQHLTYELYTPVSWHKNQYTPYLQCYYTHFEWHYS